MVGGGQIGSEAKPPPMQPGEIEADFGPHFHIEKVMERYSGKGLVAGEAAYLMRTG